MGTSQSTPTEEIPNEPNQGYDQQDHLFYYPPLSTPMDQTSNRRDEHYFQDSFHYPALISTPTDQTPPVQGYFQDPFHYPPLSTPTDQTPPVQGYFQDPFYYPPMSTPTDQTPSAPVQGFEHDFLYYPPMSTPTNQIPSGLVQGFEQDPFKYPPLSMPTYQAPNGPVQGYSQDDLLNPPLVRTSDRNLSCCSCRRLKATEVQFTNLGDGRYLCPDCLSISLMESEQLKPIIRQVYSFFDNRLEFPIKKDISIFFVDANEMAKVYTNKIQKSATTLGLTVSTKATIKIVKRCVRRGADIEAVTKTKKIKRDKVAAILLLFGFPKQMVGATLAHEMMHALIRLQDLSSKLESKVEEGLCEAVAYRWLKDIAGDYNPSYTQKDVQFAEKLTKYFKCEIKNGKGGCSAAEFRKANHAIKKYGLKHILNHVARTRNIPE